MTKSKNERGNKTPVTNQSAPIPATLNAIIPGRFMESNWIELVEKENNENFIADLVDEIADCACEEVFQSVIAGRTQPYAVFDAKSLLLEIIQSRFLQCDPGNSDCMDDLSWNEDEEPATCILDSWAQGAVPLSSYSRAHSSEGSRSSSINEVNATKDYKHTPSLQDVVAEQPVDNMVSPELLNEERYSPLTQNSTKIKKHSREVRCKNTLSTKSWTPSSTTKRSAPSSPAEVVEPSDLFLFDNNACSYEKLTLDKLPNHRIHPRYAISDQPRVEKKTGTRKKATVPRVSNLHHSDFTQKVSQTSLPSLPLLIETIDVSPGVEVKEGQFIKRGPKLDYQNDGHTLQPINSEIGQPLVNANDIINQSSMVLTPAKPLPAILQS